MKIKEISLLVIGITLIGLSYHFFNTKKDTVKNRWYKQEQLSLGKELFIKNCASCHGQKAEKTILWKKTLKDGSYPPPPLNNKAHAWHHPKWQLMQIITEGGSAYDGKMPAFKDILSEKEIEATIAYFQSFWGDEFYKLWIDSSKGMEDKR